MTEYEEKFDSTATNMENAMNEMYSGSSNKAETATKKIQNALTKFGDVVLPIIADVFDKVGNVADMISNMDKTTQTIIVIIAAVIAALGPLLMIIGGISIRSQCS